MITAQRLGFLWLIVWVGALAAQTKGYSCEEIRGGLYWITDGAYNTMFLVTSDGVVAVDAPPTLGANYLKAIREVTDKPIRYLIYSHEHTDHIGAASLFPKSARIIAQEDTAGILKRRTDPRRPIPSIVFRDHYALKTGGEEIHLIYPGPNHQTGNILIWVLRQKTLMLVDVIYPGYMPYKNLGIVEDVPGYVSVHKTVLGYDFQTFVGGHVGRLGTRADCRNIPGIRQPTLHGGKRRVDIRALSGVHAIASRPRQVGPAQRIRKGPRRSMCR
jgi:glyoxylase-like metal-dependent hydrolase (beta-lactamase superfamily II)